MVSGAMIEAKVNAGLGKAGNAVGFAYAWYRPGTSGPAIAPTNFLGNINAYIATNKGLAAQPSNWGTADRFAAFDSSNFLAGDYLVGDQQSYFLGELVPISGMVRLVVCNETFTWSQMGATAPGPSFRRGVRVPTPQITGWPGWLAASERRSSPELRLPGSVDEPNAEIFLPVSIPRAINRGDILTTGEVSPLSWTVQGAVYSPNGWQISAIRAGA